MDDVRHGNHRDVPGRTALALAEALARCESEPIHLIGSIQPHGFLLAFDTDWRVRVASTNTTELFGADLDDILDAPAAHLLGAEAAAALAARAAPTNCQAHVPTCIRVREGAKHTTIWLHRAGDLLVCEMQPAHEPEVVQEDGQEVLIELVRLLEHACDAGEWRRLLAHRFRQLTGFDRVLVYRFDDDWDGEVLAESRNDAMPSLLGNHFPASDIPAQARALYASNPVRVLADTEASAVALAGGAAVDGFDMSLCVLRSMSPIHLEYLRNMGARAALSVPLMVHGRLWGLIACHNAQPLTLSLRQLAQAEIVGRTASLNLSSLEDRRQVAYLDQIRHVLGRMTKLFANSKDVGAIAELLEREILALVGATGCLLVTPGQHVVAGLVPNEAKTAALLAWLQGPLAEERIFATHHLSRDWAEGASIADIASGLLAIHLTPGRQLYVLWFREEIICDIPWAGKPQKEAISDQHGVRIEPRRSFEQWMETVRCKSRKWAAIEIDSATTISHALHAIFTERSLWAMEHDLRVTAESANRLKGQFLNNISHELRTPLHAIMAFTSMCLKRLNEVPAEKLRQYLDNIQLSANRLNHLVDELLNLAQLQSGRVTVARRAIDLGILISTVVREMRPQLESRSLAVSVVVEADNTRLHGDNTLIGRVIHHLLTNAQKFSPVGGTIEIVLRDAEMPDEHGTREAIEASFLDSGPGIPEEELPLIFESFTQSTRTYRGDGGSGLGLAVCREIVALHKGFIQAHNRPEGGACIRCRFPRG